MVGMKYVLLGVAVCLSCTSRVGELPAVVYAPVTLSVGGWEVPPGMSPPRCIVVRLGNEKPAFVTSVRSRLGVSGHHVTLLRTDATQEQLEPVECVGFGDVLGGGTQPLTISQVPDDTVALPLGVGFLLPAHAMVKVEAHFLNEGRAPVTAEASVTIQWSDVPADAVPAAMGFYGIGQLEVPVGEWSSPWEFVPLTPGMRVFGVSAHTHGMATTVEIEHAPGADAPGMPLYPGETPFDYRAPAVAHFNPVHEVHEGEGLRYRCTWNNTTGKALGFGEEMCVLWAYEFPAESYRVCMHVGDLLSCCPGDGCDSLGPLLMQPDADDAPPS